MSARACGAVRTHDCLPASVAKRDVEGVGLGRRAGLSDQAIGVESHWVLVDCRVMQEVPVICARVEERTRCNTQEGMGRTRCWA